MGGGHPRNVGLDSAIILSEAPYLENAPTLGLYHILTCVRSM
jgi:hypothetical protein